MKARVISMAALLMVAACRNVDLPSSQSLQGGDAGVGPSVALDFAEGTPVALSAPLSFQIESVYGVANVTLHCAQVELASWTTPPFERQVDLTPCVPFGQPTDAGDGVLDLALVVTATDARGVSTPKTFHLTVNAAIPVITTDLPDRIRPGQPLDFTLTSSIVPGALPSATLGDAPVSLTPQDGGVFLAHLDRTPPLGVDALDGGAVTLDVLTDVERAVDFKAQVVAPNGNTGKLARTVLVSRVLWDKPLPGPVFNAATVSFDPEPVAVSTPIAQGLVVPLSQDLSGSAGFNTATYLADSGSIVFDAPLLDGGWSGELIDEDGWVMAGPARVRSAQQGLVFANPLDPSAAATVGDGGTYPFGAAVRVAHQLCTLTMSDCAATPGTVQCVSHTGKVTTQGAYDVQKTTVRNEDGGSVLSSELVAARSGSEIFFSGMARCKGNGPTFAIGKPDGVLAVAPDRFNFVSGSNTWSCTYHQIYPIVPTGDGEFVVFSNWDCFDSVSSTQFIYRPFGGQLFDENATQQGFYAVGNPEQGTAAVGILGTTGPAHDLLVLESSTAGTALERYPSDGGLQSTATIIPGIYAYPAGQKLTALSIPQDVVHGTDGWAILTTTDANSESVVRLGPDLQPRWVYRYPRVASGNDIHLYSFDENGPLYLVDSYNSRVVAIER